MRAVCACIVVTCALSACTAPMPEDQPAPEPVASDSRSLPGSSDGTAQTGEPTARREGGASFYSDHFQGHKTATGERFTQNKLTAASPDLPLGANVTVTNRENGKSVDVEVNDRGPARD